VDQQPLVKEMLVVTAAPTMQTIGLAVAVAALALLAQVTVRERPATVETVSHPQYLVHLLLMPEVAVVGHTQHQQEPAGQAVVAMAVQIMEP
jgi:hypothetical protein